jgi:iron complex outermembrane receptor protein
MLDPLRAAVVCGLFLLSPWAATAQSIDDLRNMSIEELAKVEISSVSKTPEPLSDAAAAIYVISHDDIIRSGATSIPEMLRLAPNLFVAQTGASSYTISARGFSGNGADQNFPNKLLVLIDGRSVYSPLYSGVYWDAQDVLPENVERIEVISGPGATLWGANAVNGVINIITRKSSDTQGGALDIGGGNLQAGASLQYGGRIADDLTYRVYGKDIAYSALQTSTGSDAHDAWNKPQGGFRVDWTPAGDAVTLEGDLYHGTEQQLGAGDQLIAGGNLTAQWRHELDDGANLQLLAYYDDTRRATENGGGAYGLHTYDLEVQHSFPLGTWNNIVWGVGDRVDQYWIDDRISPVTSLLFVPPSRTLNLANAFIQDNVSVTSTVKLTVGVKLENDPYSGVSPMPSVRLSWLPTDGTLLWSAASRAVRSPTPFDVDVVEKVGATPFLTGSPNFQPEKLTSYELGYRGQFTSRASLSISTFFNVYDDLKSIEFSPGDTFPLQWGNTMEGNVYGVEIWGTYRLYDWWKLNAGFNIQHEALRFKAGGSGLLGVAQAGDDSHHQAQLRSSMNLTDTVSFDADFRYVGELPNPAVPSYVELNTHLGWNVTNRLTISLSGFNLLHAHHQEFTIPSSDEIERSFFIDTRWRF